MPFTLPFSPTRSAGAEQQSLNSGNSESSFNASTNRAHYPMRVFRSLLSGRTDPRSPGTGDHGSVLKGGGTTTAAQHSARQGSPQLTAHETGVDLYWLPLGAGGHSVRLNGRVFEAVAAGIERRRACDLYHSALEVHAPQGRFVIEMTPIRAGGGAERGVVAEGAVGAHAAGRFRLFRYEVRRQRDGVIPDVAEAVESPHLLSEDPACARRLLELVPQVPTPVWGRDQLHAGEMWNSNSLISWLIARSGLDIKAIHPPARGRAPGWQAGIVIAHRQQTQTGQSRVAGSRLNVG